MKKIKLFSLILFLQSISLQAQDSLTVNKLNVFTKHIAIFANEFPQEKVYIHFDNSGYYLGETIWFKAYVVTPERNELTELSKTLYVELVTPEGRILETRKLKIENGQCHGEFELKKINIGGFYEVRGYTRNMLNFDQSCIFSRVFPIFDKPRTDGKYERIITERPFTEKVPAMRNLIGQKENLTMSFFPEGGNMVTGLSSKVAFKATSKNGENAIISGTICDVKGKIITEIETQHLGMGMFAVTPTEEKYYANVHFQNKDYSFELPLVKPAGYTLSVENGDEKNMNIVIQKSNTTADETLGLNISCRGKIYGWDKVQIGAENALMLNFPKKSLPTGVIQITLFNKSGDVLAERLAFVNHQSQMKIEVTQDKPFYNPFEKVWLNFQLNAHSGNPIETTFSVSVHDATTSGNNPFGESILTNLLLSSELKGYIENPDYYFETADNSRKKALDLLLLTQGWSRYVWKQMAGITPFKAHYPIEKSLLIEGHVLSLFGKKPVTNVDVSLYMTNDSLTQTGTCKTEKDGIFNFALKDFYGQGTATIQTKINGKKRENYIPLERTFSPGLKTYSFYEKKLQDMLLGNINPAAVSEDTLKTKVEDKIIPINEKDHQMNEVTVKGKKILSDIQSSKVNIEYNVEKEMDKFEDKGEWEPETLEELMHKLNPYYSDSPNKYKGKKLLFIYDNQKGRTSLDADAFSSVSKMTNNAITTIGATSTPEVTHNTVYSPNEIEAISIVEDEATVSKLCMIHRVAYEPNLVIAIVKIYQNGERYNDQYGSRKTRIEGYSYVKEFYSPKYDKTPLPTDNDYRRTLYWNPDVKTDKEGKAFISFFNNGTAKTLNINAETVTEKGIIGSVNK